MIKIKEDLKLRTYWTNEAVDRSSLIGGVKVLTRETYNALWN